MPPLRPLAAAFLLVLAAGSVHAQSAGYTLDESGNWVRVDTPEPGSDEALMAQARQHLAENRPAAARSILNPWLEVHQREAHPLLAEAYLLRADALVALGQEYQALYDYEAVIKNYPNTDEFIKANERELDIALRYVNGMKRKLWGMWRTIPAFDIGEELLIRVQERLPNSRLAERAGIELADYYFRNRDMPMAVEAYTLFLENYPRSSYASKAEKRRIYATIARYKGPRYDGTPLVDAQVFIRRFQANRPAEAQSTGLNDALVARLQDSAANEMLTTAQWYLANGDPVSAKYILQRLLARYPQTAAAQTALRVGREKGWFDFEIPAEPVPSPAPPGEEIPPAEAEPGFSPEGEEAGGDVPG